MGKFFIGCLFLLVLGTQLCSAAVRHYYITAEDVSWDYDPSKRDLLHGMPIPPPFNQKTEFSKTRFIEYTDATFTTKKPQPEWLGILGPVIRGEVGDEIIVDFWNRSTRAHSIHPHGLRYDKASEGAHYIPSTRGAGVLPGARFTYHWFADEGSGPGPADVSSVVWWYHPHSDEGTETNAGLLGPIIITGKGKARPDGTPKDIDKEFVVAFMIFDEMKGKDAGMFHAINGYVFGNLPGLIMQQGQKVRWYLMGMGNEKDLHTPHWHGKTLRYHGRNTDVVELLPASMASADMVADNPGTWLFHCQVNDHMEAGMMTTYTIYKAPDNKSCPVKFESGKFWEDPQQDFSLHVRNTSGKTISRMILAPGTFLTRMDFRPSLTEWITSTPISPGGEQEMTAKNYLYKSKEVLGWAFFPRQIVFSDGTKWEPKEHGECFKIFWRDQEHPDLPILPEFQVEGHED